MTTRTCEIAVIGGGIVGTACLLGLRRAGFDACLVERGQAPPPAPESSRIDPRVYAITRASAGWLASLDRQPILLPEQLSPIRGMRIWDQDPATALAFDATDAGADCLGWIAEHGTLLHAIDARCDRNWISRGVEVEHLVLDDSGATLQLSDQSTLQAELVIGAEGAHSRVREAADIDVVSWDYEAEAVVAHLHTSIAHDQIAVQRFIRDGAVALLPLKDGRRSLVWSTRTEEARALRSMGPARFCRQVEEVFQSAVGTVSEPTERLGFPLRLLHARDYVATRCALVGDSAHVVHPLAGQGLNLGLSDAAALVDTLEKARSRGQDWTSLRCLHRYQRARSAENMEMLALTDALGRAWSVSLPGVKNLLNRGLMGVDRASPIKAMLARRASGT